jgi:subfamily B ATP-binding cassette protein MsbA
MIVFPVCIVPIVIYGRKVRKSARAVQGYNAELTNLMHESFTGNRVIKAYNLEDTVIQQFKAITQKYVGQLMRVIRANEIPSQLMELFGATGIALVFFYVQHLPPDQRPKATDFFTFILAIVMIYPPIKTFTRLHNQLHQARAASERVFELLAMKNAVPEPAAPKMLTPTRRTSFLKTLISTTAKNRCCATSTSLSKPASSSRSSVPAVPAKPRSPTCCCVFTTRCAAR